MDFSRQREEMVHRQLEHRGINNKRVLQAFKTVPRHKFVPERLRNRAYEDGPLPIGEGQTISQPYIVARMIQALNPRPEDRMLEIGAGSGYAAAILSRIIDMVYAVERDQTLAERAEKLCRELGYDNIDIRVGDGTLGLEDEAPFAGIMVSAAAPGIPEPLMEQLLVGGRLVIPVGDRSLQKLLQITKPKKGKQIKKSLGMVRFVPLIGLEGWQPGL